MPALQLDELKDVKEFIRKFLHKIKCPHWNFENFSEIIFSGVVIKKI